MKLFRTSHDVKMDSHSEFGRWLSTPSKGEEVVISGVSGRFPETNSVVEFKDNLFQKKDLVTAATASWNINHPEIPNRKATVPNTDKFDVGYFGLHYRQAHNMDPSIRKVLEISAEAIIDAGVNPSDLKASKTGVFVGSCRSEKEIESLVSITEPQRFGITGYYRSFVAHRISYYLKLKSPSCSIDTACSSSSNALELAYRSIRMGKCDQAIVVGSNLLEHPRITHQFYKLGVLSDDGKCKVFDEEANGYARSESMVCVFLQKSQNARRVYGQVIYSKVNCDGFKEEGITFPSKKMQETLMTEILMDSSIKPSEISFLEAHGTGTKVGDPEEAEAIDNAIASKRTEPLLIGSVKCNIGHTEPSSGLCSLVKVIIAMETGYVPPNIYLNQLRKGVAGFESGRIKVITEKTKIDRNDAIIGINNFGFGGNNTHMLLRRFTEKKQNGGLPRDDLPRFVCVSGRTKDAVLTLLNDLNTKPIDAEYVGLLHQIFKANVEGHLYRGFTIVEKTRVIAISVKKYDQQPKELSVFFGNLKNNYQIIGKHLLGFSQFRTTIVKLGRIEKCMTEDKINVTELITSNRSDKKYDIIAAVAVGIGVADLLKVLDLNITAVYGESLGKLATAYYYDDVTLEEAVMDICELATLSKMTPITILKNYQKEYSRHSITQDGHQLSNVSKNSIVINISDTPSRTGKHDVHLTDNFLQILGRLYEKGHNPQIQNLYPKINFPVSRNTPMISHLFKWDYNKSWYTYKFEGFDDKDCLQQDYLLSYSANDDNKYIRGHIIDGRNLIPAIEYLCLVWKTLARKGRLVPQYLPVVFENCKFIRAVVQPKTDAVNLLVSIQNETGNFEICEKNSIIVSGRIKKLQNRDQHFTNFPLLDFDEQDQRETIEQDEIYTELYLRGYNYSGLFKGIKKCKTDASVGLVQWENNWVTFIDKMLQLSILQFDTKSLYVPVGIKKLVIDSQYHFEFVESQKDKVCPVYSYKNGNVIKCGGIEISGLRANSISKKKPRLEPVLEKYVFIPNVTKTSLEQSARINVQIILENVLENNLKVVEIVDKFTKPDSAFLSPLISEAASDLPLVAPDLTISTQSMIEEVPNVKVANFVFTSTSNLLVIVGTKLLQRETYLKQLIKSLKPNGFVITREENGFTPENLENLQVFTEHSTDYEKIILLQKTDTLPSTKFVEVSSSHFEWLSDLQKQLKSEKSVAVYSNNKSDGIVGLVNCSRRESGGNKVKCFFMMDGAPQFDAEIPFYQKQIKKKLAINIYKDGNWGTYRHLLLDQIGKIDSQHCYVNATNRGDLSSLKWLEGPLTNDTKLSENQILVYPYYSALNFKDVVIASGHVNVDVFTTDRLMQEYLLGIEFSGKDVTGRRVMGMANSGALATKVLADSRLLMEVPPGWTFEEAATVVAVYATVICALFLVTKLKPGTSILIHSATGGIGLAALNVCLYHSCDIYVTVGTQEKRDYLRKQYPQIPESHIGNSRNTTFEEMIKTQTHGRGVDIVLNSLSEEKLKASIRCMAQGGDFIEIGKFDLGNDAALSMLLLQKNVNYHGVMLDKILANNPTIKNWIGKIFWEGIELGYVKPLPTTIFGGDEVEKAFRYMTTGKHIGKVLVKIRDEDEIDFKSTLRKVTPRFNCNPEKSYIIIGGLGGFGLELADWLYVRGVKKLILVSRSGIKSGYQTQKIRNWESFGVTITVSTKNVTTKQGCTDLLHEATELGPIDGIFNLAVVLKDALFEDQTQENFIVSLAPKAIATAHLDELSRQFCPDLRYFVIFSSVSCGRGNVGQTNYGMANSVMERICEKRKSDGLPAVAIQWGAIGDVGLVAKMQKENKELVIGGTLQQKIFSCLEVLDNLLKQDNPIVASMVVAEKNKGFNAESAVAVVAHILGIKDLKLINPQTPLAELGMDSMTGAEIIQILEKDFEIYINPKELRSMTFEKLIEEEKMKNSGENNNFNFIQCMPTKEICSVPVMSMSSNAKDEDIKTVFLLPGFESILTYLQFLATNIKANVFGIQYSYDDPEDSVEQTAKNILPHIEANLTDRKSFTIIGYSFGSDVGLEATSLLEQKGYKGTLIIIDGSPSYLSASVKKNFPVENESEFQCLLIYKPLCLFLPEAAIKSHEEKLFKCKTLTECGDFAETFVPKEVIEKHHLERQGAVVLYKRIKSMVNYKFNHEKIKSTVYLVKAKIPMIANAESDYQLSNVCEKPVESVTVDGDHFSILKQPELVDFINKYL